ncbi:MAG: uroporphyrinogen-III C-methyltransferase [Alphaproteobacteria bacterium GM202ARS2]|nr:uroporphyrinogen-III C-methyltransferase [Alphaproteobacteria bacterium GM202ARS2]
MPSSPADLLAHLPLAPDAALPPFRQGEVWLVGTGPGDPTLLTIQALYAIVHADVILHDALVSPAILKLIPQKTQVIRTGKRHHDSASMPQSTINEHIIAHARTNKRVARLKGGDPLLFARGGDEALALANAHITLRIIPGITAATAAAANAGLPLTYRNENAAITFLTGTRHDTTLHLPSPLPSLPSPPNAIALYMATHNLPTIAQHLLTNGYKKDDPVTIISNASLPQQTITDTTLAACTNLTITPPAIILISGNASLRKKIKPYLQNTR